MQKNGLVPPCEHGAGYRCLCHDGGRGPGGGVACRSSTESGTEALAHHVALDCLRICPIMPLLRLENRHSLLDIRSGTALGLPSPPVRTVPGGVAGGDICTRRRSDAGNSGLAEGR